MPQTIDLDTEFARIVDELTRRGFLAGGLGSAALAALASCGSPPTSDDASSSSLTATRRVPHKYGTTDLSGRPSRVVTLGYTDQEPVLALGVRPVGVVDFFGERPYGDWPWERPLWKDAKPHIVGERDDYNFEQITKLQPDLIIGMYSGMTEQHYRTLSKIAPTVAQPVGYADFAAPWTAITELAGLSLGRVEQASAQVASVQARFAAARKAHSEWSGKTVAVAEPFKADQWAVFGAGDPKLQFMEGLGFVVAPAVRALEPGGDVATISTERLDLLDVDHLVLLIDTGDQTQAQVQASPLFSKLAVAREGRTVFQPFSAAPAVGAALAFNSVLSIPFGIEHMTAALTAR